MPPRSARSTRRGVLVAGVTLLSGVAGCSTGSTETEDRTDATDAGSQADTTDGSGQVDTTDRSGQADASDASTESSDPVETATPGATSTPDLDLREANVVGVEFEGGDGSYGFDVTLYHDDDGEDGYANWWQVESLAGDQLGRRPLLHAHSTAPFTRSETVDIPAGTTCVVVRGHDQTHDYGGQAMVVNLETGATRAVDQGPDMRAFDESDCP